MDNETLVIRSRHLRGEDGYKTFSIRVKKETVAQLDDIAARTKRSRNELIGLFLDFALERCVVEDGEE